jgi:hypothetical protein
MERFGGEIDRVIWGDGIEFFGGWEVATPVPFILIPAMTQHPFAGLGISCPLPHPPQAFFLRLRFAIHFGQSQRIMLDVDVRIGQTGQDGRPFHILLFDFAMREAFKLGFLPHSNDPPACDENRRGARIG